MSEAQKAALIAWTAFLFVLVNLSRIVDRRRRRRFAPSSTSSPTRTTSIQAIKAATRSARGFSRRTALPLPPPRQRATCAPMHAPAPPIAIERLVKIYKTVPAVDGISFTLTPGSVTGLLGGNGAGKTTTIASIMGLTTPTSGRVTVLGAEMPRQRYRVLHRMNFESPYV